jgi:hypothetical protein
LKPLQQRTLSWLWSFSELVRGDPPRVGSGGGATIMFAQNDFDSILCFFALNTVTEYSDDKQFEERGFRER